jgi:DNA-3-methyladenine glycosylase
MTHATGGSEHERSLPRGFFERPTLQVARALLGAVLLHDTPEGRTSGRIVEVEAYRGPRDRAAHSRGGHYSPRNQAMWGAAGHAYVYFVYGMHFCMNVVTRAPGVPEAVLIRALEPLDGIELMRTRRRLEPRVPAWRLCRGPGTLCRALGITRAFDGHDLRREPLRLVQATSVAGRLVVRTPRIGVAYAGPDAAHPWRFAVRGSPAVSGPRMPAPPHGTRRGRLMRQEP